MPKKSMDILTESMFYVLMALSEGAMCGIGIAGFIDLLTPAVFIGLIGAFVARAIAGKGKPETFGDGAGVLSVITLVVAVVASLILEKIANKFKLTWLEPFVMPIGMILAMIIAVVAYNVLPPEIAVFEWRG